MPVPSITTVRRPRRRSYVPPRVADVRHRRYEPPQYRQAAAHALGFLIATAALGALYVTLTSQLLELVVGAGLWATLIITWRRAVVRRQRAERLARIAVGR